jgi:hypothetical protein
VIHTRLDREESKGMTDPGTVKDEGGEENVAEKKRDVANSSPTLLGMRCCTVYDSTRV